MFFCTRNVSRAHASKAPRDKWADHCSPGSWLVSSVWQYCYRELRQRPITGGRKAARQQRKPASQKTFCSTTCLLYSLAVPSVKIHVPLVVIITYIFTTVIPTASARLFSTLPISPSQHVLWRDELQAQREDPDYHLWWKARKEKKDW